MPTNVDIIASGAPNLYARSVTIPSGAAVSEIVATEGMALIAVITPAVWTAARIGYKAGLTLGSTFLIVYDSGGNAGYTLAVANSFIAIPQADTVFAPYLQLTSVNTGSTAAVNQAQDTVLTLLFRRYLS